MQLSAAFLNQQLVKTLSLIVKEKILILDFLLLTPNLRFQLRIEASSSSRVRDLRSFTIFI